MGSKANQKKENNNDNKKKENNDDNKKKENNDDNEKQENDNANDKKENDAREYDSPKEADKKNFSLNDYLKDNTKVKDQVEKWLNQKKCSKKQTIEKNESQEKS